MKGFLYSELVYKVILLVGLCTIWDQSLGKNGIHLKTDNRPNVIIVMTDDQGYGDLSVHGNPVLKTPELDRLHNQSIRFLDFHVSPMCTPTRGQLLTGHDAMDNGATRVNQYSMMRKDLPTMADIFKASGYQTAHFGKWHLGDSYPHRPQDRGFETTVHHGAWGVTSMADHYGNDYWDDQYLHNGELKQYEGYCTDVWFDLSIDYIKKQSKQNAPFFLYLATNAPHWPHWVDEEYSEPYLEQGLPPDVAGFFGQIANIDENMGRLIRTLDETGLADNTILVFTTDNGSARGYEVFNAGMRGSKTEPYEGGHRVPLFIRWAGGDLGQPRDITTLTQVQDLLPTVIDLAKLEKPENSDFDGMSLVPLFREEPDQFEDRMVVVEYENPYRPAENKAVLWGDWRLVQHTELYDLSSDPGQENDIAEEYPRVVAQMQTFYEKWKVDTMPDYGKKKFIHIGSEKQNPVMLYASDWKGTYADGLWNLFDGDDVGSWDVWVETSGTYEISLYRWHPASGLALDASYQTNKGEEEQQDTSIPVTKVRLKIGDVDQAIEAKPGSKSITFRVTLDNGPNRIDTWFLDQYENVLSSAYYVNVKLL